jgi:undecaprenyldiphospho-muramoylpentapeptide beta-N-acetylglucosaminyltransferase
LITAGGTGGHVYPALAVAQWLLTKDEGGERKDENSLQPSAVILWVGATGGMEAELVGREGLPFRAVAGAGLHGMGWRTLPNLARLALGFGQALGIVGRFRPQALLVTGGYVAVPVALAAWLRRVPGLVYLPDIEPGLAVRLLSRLAKRVAVTAEASRAYLPAGKVIVTGYPVRAGLGEGTREAARLALGLEPERQTLLVFGGSRGARSLNRALIAGLSDLLAHYQVIHVTGTLDWPEVSAARAALPEGERGRYHAYAYLHEEMGAALRAADLAVARAGASALGELPLVGLPAVLVPYPYAWRYQKVNADYLAERGAAIRLNDEDLAAGLVPLVRELLGDRERLAAMRRAMQALARPQAAEAIGRELLALAGGAP